MKRPRTRNILLASATALTLLAAGTAAGAAMAGGPIDGSGMIHGCYTTTPVNGLLALHLVNAGSPCPAGTTAITWNEQGPAGATGPQGPAGPTGPAGPVGPAGPPGAKGDTGAQGPPGIDGAPGPTGPAGADGHTVLNGTGAPANTLGHDGDFYIDTATDVLYGPKAGGNWPATGTSLIGTQGPKGDPGPAGPAGDTGPAGPAGPAGPTGPAGPKGDPGPQGPAGPGIASITDLNGVTCTTSGGNSGTISVSIGSGNAVTLTCLGKPVCTHSNGVGQNYTDCNDAPGEPGNPNTYNPQMVLLAAQAYISFANDGSVLSAPQPGCPGGGVIAFVTDQANNTIITWQLTGSLAGHVDTSTISSGPLCPTATDHTWT